MRILVTGGAGFIGSHLVSHLLSDGHVVAVVDNFDPFYSSVIKHSNLKEHLHNPSFRLYEADISEKSALELVLAGETFDVIVHLAAKAGVRPSIDKPLAYQQVNVGGTLNLLEWARNNGKPKFIFASSSSVYGSNPNVPWKEDDLDLRPISPYASSKIAAESYGRTYAHLFGLSFIALRFFTVYGPRQRPDLAIHKFFEAIYSNKPITLFGDGYTRRDYTFIGDILKGISAAINKDWTAGTFEAINLGNSDTIPLKDLIDEIQLVAERKAILKYEPEQAGDVSQTFANVEKAGRLLNYAPVTKIRDGLKAFHTWYLTTRHP